MLSHEEHHDAHKVEREVSIRLGGVAVRRQMGKGDREGERADA
jgi:hypothetical protein